jgi:hypothetical protein
MTTNPCAMTRRRFGRLPSRDRTVARYPRKPDQTSDETASVPAHGECCRRPPEWRATLASPKPRRPMRCARHGASRTFHDRRTRADGASLAGSSRRGDCKVRYREHVLSDVTACILLTEAKGGHRQTALCRSRNGRWCVIPGTAGVLPGCFPNMIPGSSASKTCPSCRDIRAAEARSRVDAGEETVISHAMPGSTAIIAAQLALFFERAPYRPS